ncbi:MAG: winged helix-turn-helix domain-containing protein [Candidatus Vogelbacteria bacterium]|nr:winged helix-turn-helix domain-containing protein [Candidatus Vogelbacteria bacterium]
MLHWVVELKKLGWEGMLIERLRFHGGLTIKEVAEETGVSQQTVKKHVEKLVDLGRAKWGYNNDPDELGAVRIEGVMKWQ